MNSVDDNRPNPDEILASLKKDEEKSKRGTLKIFFGMCAGVGKTYTMLEVARTDKMKGADIIIGYIETHNRKETAELTKGFESIDRKKYDYKNTQVQEMDLDAILSRKPEIVLVDELAHTNAPGSRHAKRYQDVLEILENGINVYTTLNVQHLESRSETVAQITGIIVRETVPDEIFENSDEVEVVDLTPDELIQRLAEGKVYTAERSREAIENFFRKGNITALREMALRIVADRVDKQLHDYMQKKRILGPWKSSLHILVAIDYKQQSTKLLRWAKTLAYSMDANIQALYVETLHKLTAKEEEQLNKNIKLAKQLGISLRIITNSDVVKAIVNFAQKENITHILVGKPRVRNLLSMFELSNFVKRLIRYSGNIDVYILGSDRKAKDHFLKKLSFPSFSSNISQYLFVTLLVSLVSFGCFLIKDFIDYQIVSFCLLFLISILAIFYGVGPILLAAALSAFIWDYFFISPVFKFDIAKPTDALMLLMFFIIALLNGILTSRVRLTEKKTRIREERTQALYQLTKTFSTITNMDDVTRSAVENIRKYFNLESTIILKNDADQLENFARFESKIQLSENEISIAAWVFKHSVKAGKHTETLPSSNYTFYPLIGNSGNMGVVAVEHKTVFTQGEEQFWDTFLSQISGKYEREYLRDVARKAYLKNESDKLYRNLFDAISRELQISLDSIIKATDELLVQREPDESQLKLFSEISGGTKQLQSLVKNLFNLSHIETGQIQLNPEWSDVKELINNVSENLKHELKDFNVSVVIPEDMPRVYVDFGLMEEVVYHLVRNALQNTISGNTIRIKIFYDNGTLSIVVMDRGRHIHETEIMSLFNKLYLGEKDETRETSFGFSIVKSFVEAHHGSVTAKNRVNGGVEFTVKIPVEILK